MAEGKMADRRLFRVRESSERHDCSRTRAKGLTVVQKHKKRVRYNNNLHRKVAGWEQSADAALIDRCGDKFHHKCEHCGKECATIIHILRECPALAEARAAAIAAYLPGLDYKMLHPSFLFGIAPEMAADPDKSF